MTTPTPAPTPAPVDPPDNPLIDAINADNARLQADVADLATLDNDGGPPRRRRNGNGHKDESGSADNLVDATDEPVADGPDPSHPSHMPAQWRHPFGPWGDTPAQSRTN